MAIWPTRFLKQTPTVVPTTTVMSGATVNLGWVGPGGSAQVVLPDMNAAQAQYRAMVRAILSARANPELPAYLTPDEKYPDTMGWRSWNWDLENRRLYSPVMWTPWDSPELHCDAFDSDHPDTWGAGGIHARRVPRAWETALPHDGGLLNERLVCLHDGLISRMIGVTGIVERFGKYVLGTQGWRSEWAAIRKLRAPSEAVGLDLEKAFPDVEVIYGHW